MKRSPGRPHVDDDDESQEVGVTFPRRQFDAYAKRALLEDVSVPEIVRRELRELRRRRTAAPCE